VEGFPAEAQLKDVVITNYGQETKELALQVGGSTLGIRALKKIRSHGVSA
jgi:hypothetical protein